jgi:uncharacterized OsmC-like protein
MQMSLRDYLTHKASAMKAYASTFASGDAAREAISAECVADEATGARRVQIRDFSFVSDSGPGFGGSSLGPSSPELLLGVLASCLTHTYLIGAATKGIPLDKVNVRMAANNNDAAFLGLSTGDPPYPFEITAHVHIETTAPAGDVAALHEYAATTCPLTKLIREPGSVTIGVES